MAAVATAFRRCPAPVRLSRSKARRRALQALLSALDRLAPPRDTRPDAELPSEWFKYPPI
jgi:hypothetical protein